MIDGSRRNYLPCSALVIAWQLMLPPVQSQCARTADWPQWRGPHCDGTWRESGVVDSIPDGGLSIKWRARILNGWSGPAVAAGRVFVTDHNYKSSPEVERVLCF